MDTLSLLVRQIRFEAVGINSYELVDPNGGELPSAPPGSHIDIHLKDGTIRQYSLSNDPADRRRYVIAVLREEGGRGGSKLLHDSLHVQHRVTVSLPRNNFALAPDAKRHLLIGGGIGITPLKAMAHQLDAAGANYHLHYCAKTADHAAFREEFATLDAKGQVSFHFDGGNPADGLDIAGLLRSHDGVTHVYYCGPPGFMAACAAATAHWPKGMVHSEHFKAPVADAATSAVAAGTGIIEIASTGQRLEIPPGQSIVDVLNDAGIAVPTSCVSGLCGTCTVRYISGEVDHQDHILDEEERRSQLTTCVSRPAGGILVLDL